MARWLVRRCVLFLLLIPSTALADPDGVFLTPGGWAGDGVRVRLAVPGPGLSHRYSLDASAPGADRRWEDGGVISITNATVVRVQAWSESGPVGRIWTRLYGVGRGVEFQDGRGFPRYWGTNAGMPVVAHYAMHGAGLAESGGSTALESALRSLPWVSLVIDPADLWDPVRGIYSNPRESGAAWERAASMEWIPTGGAAGWEQSCGVRIQGGWNRRPEESPKHAFRIIFRRKYGNARLRESVFEPGSGGSGEVDEWILRAGCNNSWLHWSAEERRRGDYLRDEWMRRTQVAMGGVGARGTFVHLFLNGLYWGIYDLVERPGAVFAARHLGGGADGVDVRNGDNLVAGNDRAWRELFRGLNAAAGSETLAVAGGLVDVGAFADYMLLNIYGANADWDRSSNWYAARRRRPPGPWLFFVWDGERTLEGVGDERLGGDDDQSPLRLFRRLRESEDFRRVMGERARRHLSEGGALGSRAAGARYRGLVEGVEAAMVAEAARWGAYRKEVHPYREGPYEVYTRDRHWRPEVDRLLREYFPMRTGVVIGQLEKAGLW